MTTVSRIPQKRQETPGERADRLGSEGYRLRRTQDPGVYLLVKPDGSREYRVDVPGQACNCQSTAWWGCKHLLYAAWFWHFDRCARDMAEARRRGVLVAECESKWWAAEWQLGRIVGTGAVAEIGRAT